MTLAKLLVQEPELNAHKESAPVKKGLDKWKCNSTQHVLGWNAQL